MKNFWHMQMHQPSSPAGIEKHILISRGVIGLDKWENEEAGQQDAFQLKMEDGDIVAVKHGAQLMALVEVDGPYFESTDDKEFDWLVRRRKVKILDWYRTELGLKVSPRGTLTRCDQDGDAESTKSILKWYNLIQSGKMKNQAIELLKYKKQIILQGPPGTGKTRLAKEITKDLCKIREFSPLHMNDVFKPGLRISSSSGRTEYIIQSVTDKHVVVKLTSSEEQYPIPFSGIVQAFESKQWDGGLKNNQDSYRAALAKYLFENQEIGESGEFKLIQFHPAYSYDDFVRGIVADTTNGVVSYRSINKVFGELAAKAWQNYQDSKKTPEQLSEEQKVDQYIDLFRDYLEDEIELKNGKLFLEGTTTYLFQVDEDAVRYTGDNWKLITGQRLLFSDIKRLYLSGVNTRQEIKASPSISGLAKHHSSYFLRVLNLFKDFVKGKTVSVPESSSVSEKNYVLIIDEINRANLPSVLGELIYGLEYRGESVDSIYKIDGSCSMVIPPNLYIIGTMNTADRSVGHIDYAIRRRFAFVDVHPSDQPIKEVVKDPQTQAKALELFQKVSALFQKEYLNSDFKAEEVQLGHSYFLAENEANLKLKLDFEIKPLLKEYVKDGILNEKTAAEIEKL